jgi:hypothetical protein
VRLARPDGLDGILAPVLGHPVAQIETGDGFRIPRSLALIGASRFSMTSMTSIPASATRAQLRHYALQGGVSVVELPIPVRGRRPSERLPVFSTDR